MQMLETVDWGGDGDDDDFFLAIERVFDIRLRSNLPWTTFGQVREHVIAHALTNGGEGTICASQMTFYRLRRALGLGRNIGPEAPLAPLLGRDLRRAFVDLEADTNLKMPETRPGVLGLTGVICFAISVALVASTPLPPLARILAAGASAYVGVWLRSLDPRRLPKACETIGKLATQVANQNRGRLAREGARLTEAEIWRIIQQLAAAESGVDPDLIGPQTTFFRQNVRAA